MFLAHFPPKMGILCRPKDAAKREFHLCITLAWPREAGLSIYAIAKPPCVNFARKGLHTSLTNYIKLKTLILKDIIGTKNIILYNYNICYIRTVHYFYFIIYI